MKWAGTRKMWFFFTWPKAIENSVPSFMCLAVDCRHLYFEWARGTQQIFISGGSALRFKSLLFYISFLKQKVTLF